MVSFLSRLFALETFVGRAGVVCFFFVWIGTKLVPLSPPPQIFFSCPPNFFFFLHGIYYSVEKLCDIERAPFFLGAKNACDAPFF